MPNYNAGEGDPRVIAAAYAEARRKTDNPVILQALFEAGLVESGFKNLSGGDRDSQGFLQQRPSQGWSNPTNVAHATDAFIAKAERVLASNPNISAGDLAQRVQVSAYPDRYAQASSAASSILRRVSNGQITGATTSSTSSAGTGGGAGLNPDGSSSSDSSSTPTWLKALAGGLIDAGGGGAVAGASVTDGSLDPLTMIAAAIMTALAPLKDIGQVADWVFKASLPTTMVRIAAGIGGAFFLFLGVILLAREVKTK